MSIRLMTKIWDSNAYSGGTLLVLLALADWGADDGSRIFPKVAALARKARLNERQVQRCLKQLRDDDVLSIERAATGKPGEANEYRLNVGRLQDMASSENSDATPAIDGRQKDTPDNSGPEGRHLKHEGVTSVAETGDKSAAVYREPSSNTSTKPSRKTPRAVAPSLPGFEYPEWWPFEAWDGYVDMRKKIRAPLTDRGKELAIRQVIAFHAQGADASAILDQSTQKSWRGLFPISKPRDGVSPTGGVVPIEQTGISGWCGRLQVFHYGGDGEGEDVSPAGSWSPKWGPKPGEPGCCVPADAQAIFDARHAPRKVG